MDSSNAFLRVARRQTSLSPVSLSLNLHLTVARAFRIHAWEHGFDYRRSSTLAFGGSGAVHALAIARKRMCGHMNLRPADAATPPRRAMERTCPRPSRKCGT